MANAGYPHLIGDRARVDRDGVLALLEVSYGGKKIGVIRIDEYRATPPPGRRERRVDNRVGALLKAIADIDCGCGGYFKWRQSVTEQRGNETTKNNQLDTDGKDGEFYPDFKAFPLSAICAYTFVDQPEQPADVRLEFPPGSPRRIDLVTVKFVLELVRVRDKSQRNGGEVVRTIDLGFWYTLDSNGLFNYGPEGRFE